MQPPLKKEDFAAALEEELLDPLAAKVIWNVGGRALVQSVTRFEVPDGLRLQGSRRIGTHPEARNRIGHYPVLRDGFALLLAVESRLEMAWVRWFDFQASVDWMQTQPLILTWDLGGRGAHLFPDLLVRRDGWWHVVDVKRTDDLSTHVRLKFDLARRTLAAAGVEHHHVGEITTQADVNLRIISRYKRPNPAYVELMELVVAERPNYVAQAVDLVGSPGIAREALFTLMANGYCEVNLDEAITAVSRLYWDQIGRSPAT